MGTGIIAGRLTGGGSSAGACGLAQILSRQSMVDKSTAVTAMSEHYIVRRADDQIGLGNTQSDDEAAEFILREDDDGMLIMRGGILAPKVFSGVETNAANITGNFVTSETSSTGNYARDIGDTFDLNFTGTGLEFYHYADDRGGIWDVVIDGAAAIQISTYSATAITNKRSVVVTGLSSGAHTCTFTFAGDDPGNAPSSGAGTSRGWFIRPNAPGYRTGVGIDEAAPMITVGSGTDIKSLMTPSSISEFAINCYAVGSGDAGQWVPQHGPASGACRNVVRNIIINGESIGADISGISEVSQPVSSVKIVQSYTAYNANDVAGDDPLWDGVLVHEYKEGVLTVQHTITVTSDIYCVVGYLNMFSTNTDFTDEFRNGEGYKQTISDAANVDTPTTLSLTAAFVNTSNGDAATFDCDLPTGVTQPRPLVNGNIFLQERIAAAVTKLYYTSLSSETIPAGRRLTTKARYHLASGDVLPQVL